MRKYSQLNASPTEKTHFKMYKTNKGWMIAGITTVLFGVGMMRTQQVAADTTDSSTQLGVIDKGQEESGNTVPLASTINNDVQKSDDDSSKQDAQPVTNEEATKEEDNQDVSNTNQTRGNADTKSTSKSASTNQVAPVVNKTAAAQEPTNTTNQTIKNSTNTNQPASADTDKEQEIATDTANVKSARSESLAGMSLQGGTRQAPVPGPQLPPTQTVVPFSGTAQLTINGQKTVTGSYTGIQQPQADAGTNQNMTAILRVANMNKGNTVSVQLPDFMTFTIDPKVADTSTTWKDGLVTYTAISDGVTFSTSLNIQAKTPVVKANQQTGTAVVAVDNNELDHVDMSATFKSLDIATKAVGIKGLDSDVKNASIQPNEEFQSHFWTSYDERLDSADYKSYTITLPVPAGYVLDVAASNQATQLSQGTKFQGWTYSQAAPGADVVMTMDPTKITASGDILREMYLVGKMTGAATGNISASGKPTEQLDTIWSNSRNTTGQVFSVNVAPANSDATSTVMYSQKNDTVYVGPTDVGVYNVMQSDPLTIISNTNSLTNAQFDVQVPEGTTSNGFQVAMDQGVRAMGGAATVIALDQNGNTIDQTSTSQLLPDSNGRFFWAPKNAGQIASYQVKFDKLINSTFGKTTIMPMLSTNSAIASTQKLLIPVSFTGTTTEGVSIANVDPNYFVNLTSSHKLIISNQPHLDASNNPGKYYQQGDIATSANHDVTTSTSGIGRNNGTVNYYPFDQGSITSYNMLDKEAVMYVPIPNDTTYAGINRTNVNVTPMTDGGQKYVRIVIPAGTPVTDSANPAYNLPNMDTTMVNAAAISARIDPDVTPATRIAIPNEKQAPMFMGIKDDQLDTSNGWKTWTLQEISDLGYTDIATQLAAAGYTGAYSETAIRDTTLTAGNQWPIVAPTSFVMNTTVKADVDQQYVSGDGTTGIATFYPSEGKTTGTIRTYLGNGGDATLDQATSLISLPKKADGQQYSLNLTGPVTVPAGFKIQYSTEVVQGTQGQALDATQLASFTDGTGIDWAAVKSVLITANNVAQKTYQQVILPIKVADFGPDVAAVNAQAFNYAVQGGTVLTAGNTELPTRIAEAQRVLTVNYVDGQNNEISMPATFKGAAGDHFDLTPVQITGYTPTSASTVDYIMTDDANQTVTFKYVPQKMAVDVYYYNSLNNLQIKTGTINELVGAQIDLTTSAYRQVTGYTANPNNAVSYKVTTEQKQAINLFFAPDSVSLTVKYQNENGDTIAPNGSYDTFYGATVQLTPVTVDAYTPKNSSANYTVNSETPTYTFVYKYTFAPGKVGPDESLPHVQYTKTVHRTVVLQNVDGSTPKGSDGQPLSVAPQTLTFTGEGTSPDHITWHPLAGATDASQTFAAEDIPTQVGYSAAVTNLAAQTITGDSQDVVVTIKYVPNLVQVTTRYITVGQDGTSWDIAAPGTQIATYGSSLTLTAPTISGFTLAKHQPNTLTKVAGVDGANFAFVYDYAQGSLGETPITFSKVIDRTIHYQYSDGSTPIDVNGQPLQDTVQKIPLKGQGFDDQQIAWWPTAFPSVTVPAVPGATPDVTTVPVLRVLDDATVAKVIITYTRNSISGGNGTGNSGATNPGNDTGKGNSTDPNAHTNTGTNVTSNPGTNTIPNTDLPSTFGGVGNGTNHGSGVANNHNQNVDHNSTDGHGGLPNTFNGEGSQNGQVSANVTAGSASDQTQSGSNAFRNGQNGRQATLPQTGDGDASKTGVFGLIMLVLTGLGALLPNRRKN